MRGMSPAFATESPASQPRLRLAGPKPAVVLLHGLYSSPLEVRLFARTLVEHGFHVVIPRVAGYSVGHGDTEAPYERWIEAVMDEARRLRRVHPVVHLCGVSLGATLALAVASQGMPAIASLALISTTLFYDGWNVSRWRFLLPLAFHTPLGRLYTYRETPPFGVKNERVRAWIASQLRRGDLSSAGASRIPVSRLREADRLIRFARRSLGHVHVPLLLIHAREDDVASLANVRHVAAKVSSRVVRELVVAESYHMITLDNDRDLAASSTVEFFQHVASSDAGDDTHTATVAARETGPRCLRSITA